MAWRADGTWEPEDDSTANRLTGLLASDSRYVQQARVGGQRTAQRRGLLNTSIAAGSGETAAIAAAAPIASQDASQTFQRNQAVLEGGIGLNNQRELASQQFGFSRDLNQQQIDATTARDEFNAQQQLQLQEREAGFQRERDLLQQQGATDQQLREFDQRTAEQLRNIEADATARTAQLSSQERTALLSSDTNILQSQIAANSQLTGQYLAAFSQLAGDPNIPANVRNAYIAEFQRVMESGQALINVIQNTPLNWGPGATA